MRAGLARQPESQGWSEEDLLMVAGLCVDQLLMTASLFLETLDRPEARALVTHAASRHLLLISIGRRNWQVKGSAG